MFDVNITDKIAEFGIGHVTNSDAGTGVTVIINKAGATCSCDVRGGGPATRETDLLHPEKMVQKAHAVVLSGGSAMGLESASGVARELRDQKIGYPAGKQIIPIVPAACIFDMNYGKPEFPDVEMGRECAKLAIANIGSTEAPERGNVGVGAGASVGIKGMPTKPMKSGVGYACVALGKLKVAALCVVNALGNVYDTDGTFMAGVEGDALKNAMKAMNLKEKITPGTNTTLCCVMTNAKISKTVCNRVAQVAHDGYARAIFPVHTQNDGDSIFVMASDKVKADVDVVSVMAVEAVEAAIRDAVKSSTDALGLKGMASLEG